MKPEDLLTAEEVEQMLRVGKGWAYRNRHRLPHVRLGQGQGALRFPRYGIERWLDQQVQDPTTPTIGIHVTAQDMDSVSIQPRRRRA